MASSAAKSTTSAASPVVLRSSAPADDAVRQAMVRSLAYHNDAFLQSALSISRNTHAPPGFFPADRLPAVSSLGDLDRAPLEVLNIIMRNLDLQSMFTLRQVNRRARNATQTCFPYQQIVQHAAIVVLALIKTESLPHFSVEDIYRVLCTSICGVCGQRLGAFLWIPDCIRCCLVCLRGAPELHPITAHDALGAFGIKKKHLADLPVFKSVPGRYGLKGTSCSARKVLYSQTRLKQVAIAVHGSEDAFEDHIRTSPGRQSYLERAIKRMLKLPLDTIPPQGSDYTYDDTFRFMAATLIPFLDKDSQQVRNDVYLACHGCDEVYSLTSSSSVRLAFEALPYCMYTPDAFLEHFSQCRRSQVSWTRICSSGGEHMQVELLNEVGSEGDVIHCFDMSKSMRLAWGQHMDRIDKADRRGGF